MTTTTIYSLPQEIIDEAMKKKRDEIKNSDACKDLTGLQKTKFVINETKKFFVSETPENKAWLEQNGYLASQTTAIEISSADYNEMKNNLEKLEATVKKMRNLFDKIKPIN